MGKKVFATFIMPMILLAIRIEVELVFKNNYPEFFSKSNHEKVSKMKDVANVSLFIDSYEVD